MDSINKVAEELCMITDIDREILAAEYRSIGNYAKAGLIFSKAGIVDRYEIACLTAIAKLRQRCEKAEHALVANMFWDNDHLDEGAMDRTSEIMENYIYGEIVPILYGCEIGVRYHVELEEDPMTDMPWQYVGLTQEDAEAALRVELARRADTNPPV